MSEDIPKQMRYIFKLLSRTFKFNKRRLPPRNIKNEVNANKA